MLLVKLLPKNILSRQLRKPTGFIGRFLISSIFKKGNQDINRFVEQTLELESHHHVLEIGFGPGKLLNSMASITTQGHIEGIDFSDAMFDEAKKHNQAYIDAGRVHIQKGNCQNMPFSEGTFDRICAVNTLYFWKPPEPYLAEIHRLLKSGGRLVLGIRVKAQLDELPLDRTIFSAYTLEEVETLLLNAGFSDAYSLEKQDSPLASYCVVGIKA